MAVVNIAPEVEVSEAHPRLTLKSRPQPSDLTLRRARQALVLLVCLFILVQPLGPFLRNASLSRLLSGANIETQWNSYLSAPAPDVLFIGPSNAKLDVDTSAVGHLLEMRSGHTVRVGKLGSYAESSAFLEALLYRVLERPTRPSLIVFVVAAPMFNPAFRCVGCPRSLLSLDLAQISQPYEPTFMSRAWALDPEDRLDLAGEWLLPSLMAAPYVAGAVRCDLIEAGRHLARTAGVGGPPILAVPTPCELDSHPALTDHMDPGRISEVRAEYRDHFVQNYRFSPAHAAHVREMVGMARSKGVSVSLAEFPNYWLEDVNPEADRLFQAGIRSLAADLAVPLLDHSAELRSDQSFWADPLHLNASGAKAFAPMLARSVGEMWSW